MKKFCSKWKIKMTFILVCCIVFNGLAGLPIVKAGLETEAEVVSETEAEAASDVEAETASDVEAGGPVNRTDDADEVGISITKFTVQDASNRNLTCTGPKSEDGAEIYDASSNPYYDVAKVTFEMEITVVKEWNAGRGLKGGDYVLLPIPEGFSSTGSGAMNSSGRNIAAYNIVDNQLKITFTNEVNAELRNEQIKGGMDVEMTFDPKGLKGQDKTVTVLPSRGSGNPAVKLKLPDEPDTIDGISKEGKLDINTNVITWTVKVGTDKQSKGVSLDGVELTEELPEELEQMEVTAENADGADVEIMEVNGKLKLSGENAVAPVAVQIKTSITAEALQEAIGEDKSELLLTNSVSMGSSDSLLKFGSNTSAQDDVTVKLSPKIEKEGSQIDSNTIRWTIRVNADQPVRVYKGYVVDELAEGLKYKPNSIRYNGNNTCVERNENTKPDTASSWPEHELWINESDGKQTLYFCMAEDTSASYTITFDTIVLDDFGSGNSEGEGQKVHNAAQVFAQFPTGGNGYVPVEYGIPGIDTEFNTAKVNKEVSVGGKKAKGQLTWTICPSVRRSTYTTAIIKDKIEPNQEYCQDTLKIYEKVGENWEDKTETLQNEGVFTSSFSEGDATLTLEYTMKAAKDNNHSTTLSNYKIEYQTTALTYVQTNNKKDEYKNTAILTVEGDKEYTSEGSASAELQNAWVKKDTKFEYIDGVPCFHYTITVNSKEMQDLTNVIIEDSIQGAIKISDDDTDVSEDWVFDRTQTSLTVENGAVFPPIEYSNSDRNVKITFDNLSDTVTVELYAKYIGGKSELTAQGGKYKNKKVYSDNTVKVKSDEVCAENGDSISESCNTKNKDEMDNMLVQKKCIAQEKNGGMKLTWQVTINPNSGKMGAIDIKDTISKTQKYIEDSVKLYDVSYSGGKLTPAGSGVAQSPEFTVDETNRYMELAIDAKNEPLILQYQTLLLDSKMTTATNSIEASEGGVSYGTGTGEGEISGGDWGTMVSAGNLILKKQDASVGSDMPLKGAQFTIYADKDGTKPIDVGRTGDNGEAVFWGLDVLSGTQETYYYKETDTPSGYEPDDEIHAVIVEKSDTTTYTVDNIRKTESDVQKSQVSLTKKFMYVDEQGAAKAAAGKQAVFELKFYPYVKSDVKGAKVVSLTGDDGSYEYNPSAAKPQVTKITNNAQTGKIEIAGLPWGYFGIKEIETAPGFALDEEERHFEIKNTDAMEVHYYFGDVPQNNNAVLTNTATQFQVAKYEEGTENQISGIHLQICEKNSGAVVVDALNNNLPYEWDTDGTEKTIYNLPAGSYVIHEDVKKSTNLNYAMKDVDFTVLPNGKVTTPGEIDTPEKSVLKIYNKPITLQIAKVDQFDTPVSNATITMTGTDSYSKTVTTTVDQDGHILSFENLKRNGTYTLSEDTQPDAEHLKINPITVKVSEDGNSFSFTQEDESGKTVALELDEDGTLHVIDRTLFIPITVKKANGFKKEMFLENAGFELHGQTLDDSSGNYTKICDIMTNTDGSWEISSLDASITNPLDSSKKLRLGLKPGRYYLEEKNAPAGYKALPDGTKMRFKITAEGVIELEEAVNYMTVSGTIFTISNMPYTLRIQPLEFDNGYDEGMGELDLNDAGTVYTVMGKFIGNSMATSIELDGTEKDAFAQANGLMGKLIPDEVYTITEKKAPKGYIAPEPVYVRIDNQGKAALCDSAGNILGEGNSYCKVENLGSVMEGVQNGYDGLVKIYHGKTRAQLIKYTSWNSDKQKEETEKENYKILSRVTFTLKGKLAGGQKEKEYSTDDDGKIIFDGDLVDEEEYTLTETSPTGYRKLDDIRFKYSVSGIDLISADTKNVTVGMQEGIPAIEITNESEQNTSLQFLVYDCTDKTGLPGAKFKMTCVPADGSAQTETIIETNESGTVCTYNTAGETNTKVMAAGEAFITGLKPGSYTLLQTEAPYGYCLGEKSITITFEVDEAAKNKTIVINEANVKDGAYHLTATEYGPKVIDKGICNKRVDGTVVIEKQDFDDNTPLNNVGFAIYRYKEADNIFELLKNLLTGKAYEVVEKEWTETTGEDGKLTITGLDWGKYYIVETNPLTGYVADETKYDFEISKDELAQGLIWNPGTIINKKIQMIILPTNATSDQADVTGHRMRISGRFQNPDVSFIEWKETEKGYVIAGMLLPGEIYTLERREVLPGYNSSKEFQFRYNGYGDVEIVSGEGTDIIVEEDGTVKLVQKVEPLKVRILKVDEAGKPLAGAVLSLYVKDEAGGKTQVAEVTTNGSAWELTGDKYRLLQVGAACVLTEKSAPEGYALAEDVAFTIEDDTKWQEYTMVDKRKQGGNTGSGIEKDPDNGTEKDPDNGTEKEPDDGAEKNPDDETEKEPDNGAEKNPDDGTEKNPGDGTEKDSDDGTEKDLGDRTEKNPDKEKKKDSDKKAKKELRNDEQSNGKNSNSANRDGDDESDSAAILPQTGREERAGFYVLGGLLAVAGMLMLLYGRRKKKE